MTGVDAGQMVLPHDPAPPAAGRPRCRRSPAAVPAPCGVPRRSTVSAPNPGAWRRAARHRSGRFRIGSAGKAPAGCLYWRRARRTRIAPRAKPHRPGARRGVRPADPVVDRDRPVDARRGAVPVDCLSGRQVQQSPLIVQRGTNKGSGVAQETGAVSASRRASSLLTAKPRSHA